MEDRAGGARRGAALLSGLRGRANFHGEETGPEERAGAARAVLSALRSQAGMATALISL